MSCSFKTIQVRFKPLDESDISNYVLPSVPILPTELNNGFVNQRVFTIDIAIAIVANLKFCEKRSQVDFHQIDIHVLSC